MKRCPAALIGMLLGLLAVALLAAPAAAQVGESIPSYSVDIEVTAPGGDLLVTEVIDYDFGFNQRHGIFRRIPTQFTFDDTFDRVVPTEILSVSGSPGTPVQYEESREGDYLVVRIGDPDETISGLHRYEISYRVEGALNGFEDHDELYWNVVGFEWEVPVSSVNASVNLPAEVTQATCFAGSEGSSLPCSLSTTDGSRATFAHPALSAFQSMTVVVGIPKGVVAEPEPILFERWSLAKAFRATPFTVAGGLTIMLLLGALLYRQVFRRGLDFRYGGTHVDAAMGGSGKQERVGLLEQAETPVEFVPPDNLSPGQVGTLMDEKAHTLDVIATIVDLAVRDYVKIEEIPKEGLFGRPNWWLHKLRDGDGLKPYEKLLFDSIFSAGQQEVMLSQLEEKFADELRAVQDALYKDVVHQGWFKTRPDRVRQTWTGIGILLLLLGIGFLVAVAAFTEFGLMAIPFPMAGLLVLIFAHRMPAKTGKGTALARRIEGFRKFIDTSEADRARFAERKNLFSEYLPYAIVFGCTKKWAKAFDGLDGEPPDTHWYVGSPGHTFAALAFADSIGNFTVATSGTITSTPPPATTGGSGFGGGGFSGGGFGGGGGGSW